MSGSLSGSDLGDVLADLDRRLSALQAELLGAAESRGGEQERVAAAPATPGVPHPGVPAFRPPIGSAPPVPGSPSVEDAARLAQDVEELREIRSSLIASTRALVDVFDRALALYAPEGSGGADAAVTSEPLVGGELDVDAGPFGDLRALASFERALAAAPEVADVQLREIREDRARLAVLLPEPVALRPLLDAALERPFTANLDGTLLHVEFAETSPGS